MPSLSKFYIIEFERPSDLWCWSSSSDQCCTSVIAGLKQWCPCLIFPYQVFIFLGTYSYQPNWLDLAFDGAPLGEMVQWSDLIASLYILGHNLTIAANRTTYKKWDFILLFSYMILLRQSSSNPIFCTMFSSNHEHTKERKCIATEVAGNRGLLFTLWLRVSSECSYNF